MQIIYRNEICPHRRDEIEGFRGVRFLYSKAIHQGPPFGPFGKGFRGRKEGVRWTPPA